MRLKLLSALFIGGIALLGQAQSSRWDQIYSAKDSRVPVNPSALVLETTANLKPGSALDIGMGNGRNAIYLARKGWKVTGIDMSREAVRAAAAEAAKLNVTIDATQANFHTFDAGVGKYDLILCMYVPELALKDAQKIIAALKPGGLLIIEGYHKEAPDSSSAGGYKDNELLKAYGKLRIRLYVDRADRAEWSGNGDPRAPLVRMVAQKE